MQHRYGKSLVKLLFSVSLTLVVALLFGVFKTGPVQSASAWSAPAVAEAAGPGQESAGVIAAETGPALMLVNTLQVTPTDEVTGTEEATSTEEMTDTEEMTATGEMAAGEAAVRASELLDYPLVSAQDGTLGEIEDLIIGLESGQAPYAVVDFDDELLGLEDDLARVIPLAELGLDSALGAVTTELELETLRNAPVFIFETEPDLIRPDWDIELREYWQMGETVMSTQSEAMTGTETITEEAYIRASDLLEYEVINPNGEDLGEIEDLMIGLNSEDVHYVVMAAGGFLGLGEDLFAIPYRAIVVDPEIARVVFNVTEESIENAPGFDRDNWPNSADPRWDVETREFWDQTGVTRVTPGPIITGRTIDEGGFRASEVISFTVETLEGGVLGRVVDLMIGVETGQVRYALVSTGLEPDESEPLIPIPFYAFAPDLGRLTLITTLEAETLLGAPVIEPDNLPDTTDPQWDFELRDYWVGAGVDAIQPIATRGVTTTPIDEPARRASELLGAEISLSQQEGSAAIIEELIIGFDSQYVNYALLSLDQGLVPVFFPLINFDEQGNPILDVEPQVLQEAPALDPDVWPEAIIQPFWDEVFRNYWIGFGIGARAGSAEATDLLDRDVINLQGEGLGEIEDLIIGLDDGQVSYVILGAGGFLGIGETLRPVPMSELSFDPFNRVMILNTIVDEEAFENAPSFQADGWPDLNNPDWAADYQAYWTEQLGLAPAEAGDGDQAAPQAGIRASELLDFDARTVQNEDMGELEDLIINLNEDQVQYVVLSVGQFLGLGGRYIAVPFNAVTLDPAQELVALDADQETIEAAPGVEDIDLLGIAGPDWDAEIQSYWENQ